jgi:hypothetical protein
MLTRRSLLAAVFAAAFMIVAAPMARAEDKADKKDDATGTWKWSMPGRNGGQARDVTLKLKQEGDKLSGTLGGGNNETEIQDGKVKDGEISFKVVRKRNDQEIATLYHGKLSGDTITGKADTERNGETRSRDWEAKRAKE